MYNDYCTCVNVVLSILFSTLTNRIPRTVPADLFQSAAIQDALIYPCTEFAPPQDTAHRKTAEHENGTVIALYLFRRIAHMGQAVGTAGTDAVRAAGQGDIWVVLPEQPQHFRHVCGKCFAVAVPAEKCRAQAVVWP